MLFILYDFVPAVLFWFWLMILTYYDFQVRDWVKQSIRGAGREFCRRRDFLLYSRPATTGERCQKVGAIGKFWKPYLDQSEWKGNLSCVSSRNLMIWFSLCKFGFIQVFSWQVAQNSEHINTDSNASWRLSHAGTTLPLAQWSRVLFSFRISFSQIK